MWKELLLIGFFFYVNSLVVMLNVDWFRLYKYFFGFVGVIYLVLFNLFYYERYKLENVIVVGILFGFLELKLIVNIFLELFVKEL